VNHVARVLVPKAFVAGNRHGGVPHVAREGVDRVSAQRLHALEQREVHVFVVAEFCVLLDFVEGVCVQRRVGGLGVESPGAVYVAELVHELSVHKHGVGQPAGVVAAVHPIGVGLHLHHNVADPLEALRDPQSLLVANQGVHALESRNVTYFVFEVFEPVRQVGAA